MTNKWNVAAELVACFALMVAYGCSGAIDVSTPSNPSAEERSANVAATVNGGGGGELVSCEAFGNSRELEVDVSRWRDVIEFEPTRVAERRMENRDQGKVLRVQEIEDGKGKVDLDYYPVRIRGMSSDEIHSFMQRFRTRLNEFMPQGSNTVKNYKPIDRRWWEDVQAETPAPLGAVMIHRVKGFGIKELVISKLPTAVTDVLPHGGWVFSTVELPFQSGGQHAVAGSREFAVERTGEEEYVFYTKGAARPFSIKAKSPLPPNRKSLSKGAHEMWMGLIQNVEDHLDGKSGVEADIPGREITRVACPWNG